MVKNLRDRVGKEINEIQDSGNFKRKTDVIREVNLNCDETRTTQGHSSSVHQFVLFHLRPNIIDVLAGP